MPSKRWGRTVLACRSGGGPEVGEAWAKVADVKERKETVEVYVHNAGKPDQGMLVIAAEEKELAVVNILGVADLANLTEVRQGCRCFSDFARFE